MELANIFPSKYIKATDLQGREATVVIDRAEIETLGDDRKLVLYFKGKEKGLVTNRTNADRIAHMYGSNTDGWMGKSIILFCDMVNFQGRVVEAVRVRAPARNGGSVAASEREPQPPMRRPDMISSGPQARGINPPGADIDDEIPF